MTSCTHSLARDQQVRLRLSSNSREIEEGKKKKLIALHYSQYHSTYLVQSQMIYSPKNMILVQQQSNPASLESLSLLYLGRSLILVAIYILIS